jgi:hypothetical protein
VPLWLWIVIATAAAAVLLAALAWAWTAARRHRFRSEFGKEYDHAVRRAGNRREAEDELRSRRERREQMQLRPLSAQERARYRDLWARAKESFVDDPESAVHDGERLIRELMSLRGFPRGDFDQRALDLSLEDPDLAVRYRRAHEAARSRDRRTDDLRGAMREYEPVFVSLVAAGEHDEPVAAHSS